MSDRLIMRRGTASTLYRLNQTERYMANTARHRAKKRGIACTITHKDIDIPQLCPLLGTPLERHFGEGHHPDAPSLDRIDNSLGYTKDNIWVISKRANTMKNCASIPELVAFAKNIIQYFG